MFVLDPAYHIAFFSVVTVLALVAFAREASPIELSAGGLLAAMLVWTGVFITDEGPLLSPADILAGLANPTVIAVVALMIMGEGIARTHALDPIINLFSPLARRHWLLGIVSALLTVALVSAVINNTPTVIIFIPIIQALASGARYTDHELLMPLSFGAILGGMTTLMGSSTNLLVAGVVIAQGYPAIDFFAMTPLGGLMAAVGFVYIVFVLPRVLSRTRPTPSRPDTRDDIPAFATEVAIGPDSGLLGKTVSGRRLQDEEDLQVIALRRGRDLLVLGQPQTLELGDRVVLRSPAGPLDDRLVRLISQEQVTGARPAPSKDTGEQETIIAQMMVTPNSRLVGLPIAFSGITARFGLKVLAVALHRGAGQTRPMTTPLTAGDVLLVAGQREQIHTMAYDPNLLLLARPTRPMARPGRAPIAIGIFGLIFALAAGGWLPLAVLAPAGAVVMIVMGCLTVAQALRAINRPLIFIVAAALSLAAGLETSGALDLLARHFTVFAADGSPWLILVALFGLVALATNLLSNNATAVLFTPLALSIAPVAGIDPSAAALTVLLAANCSFATPMSYHTNMIVSVAGKYRFADFLIGGIPLLILLWITFALFMPFLLDYRL
ncbi:MAG: SLC13 family permease [Pseudomonadota bacterium]